MGFSLSKKAHPFSGAFFERKPRCAFFSSKARCGFFEKKRSEWFQRKLRSLLEHAFFLKIKQRNSRFNACLKR